MLDRPLVAQRCADRFAAWSGEQAELLAWAPGRINLIGGHTDYNAGLALPGAINRWIVVALRGRSDSQIRVCSHDFNGTYSGDLHALPAGEHSWQKFVAGILQVFSKRFELPSGFDALFLGDVPHGAGLSSSAALTVAWMNALRGWCGADLDDWELVRLCQEVEHEYLGVECGLLDQVASHMAKTDHVMRVDFERLSVEQVPIEMEDMSWVVVHSGVRRELSSSAFSDRVRECREGLEAVQAQAPDVRGMRGVAVHHLSGVQEPWVRRLRHLVTENTRVMQASLSIAKGDAANLGRLLLETHESLRKDYEVSCPELDVLVELASAHSNCWGARMVGGGFGGCTLNLVHSAHVEAFSTAIQRDYRTRTQKEARVFSFDLVGGAQVG